MAKIIIRWKSAFLGAACKFDVYLMNTHIGELKCGASLETSVDIGTHTLFFKKKGKFGKKADTSFEVVVNKETEVVELLTQFTTSGSFMVKYADNAPHIPTYDGAPIQSIKEHQANISNNNFNALPNKQKKNNGCLSGCLGGFLAIIIFITAIALIVSISLGNNNTSNNVTTQEERTSHLLYSDDNFKITFVDFNDPNLGVTSYNLLLKIENNSDKTICVSPSDGYANNEAVFLGSGMPVKVKPGKISTGAFIVGYGNTSIKSIDEIKTLELRITLYDENFSETILTTDDILIDLESLDK